MDCTILYDKVHIPAACDDLGEPRREWTVRFCTTQYKSRTQYRIFHDGVRRGTSRTVRTCKSRRGSPRWMELFVESVHPYSSVRFNLGVPRRDLTLGFYWPSFVPSSCTVPPYVVYNPDLGELSRDLTRIYCPDFRPLYFRRLYFLTFLATLVIYFPTIIVALRVLY